MKFQLAINLERSRPEQSMREIAAHTLDMVRYADSVGFELVWAAEHHAIEMTIAPNPFQLLTWWATHTKRIRLGCGVVNATYWHPIRLAGEAAMLDVLSDGRLEFGIGSGAYQREFDRMRLGVKREEGWRFMSEALPLVRKLWKGDVAHNGEIWNFPKATSCPKPLQDEVPVWVAARNPATYEFAVKHRCNVICWPLTRPFSEAERYKQQLNDALLKHGNTYTPQFSLMRHTAVYENNATRDKSVAALQRVLGQFENLMRQTGEVDNGFPEEIDLTALTEREQYTPETIRKNLMFGTPAEVIEKLLAYQAIGVDSFVYYASMGLDFESQMRSLRLFADKVIPAFR